MAMFKGFKAVGAVYGVVVQEIIARLLGVVFVGVVIRKVINKLLIG